MTGKPETMNLFGGLIGFGLIALMAFATWALIFREVPTANQNALLVLIGILSSNVGTVIGFYFGSSSTNKKQAETIDTLAKTAAITQAPAEPAIVLQPGEQATVVAPETGP